MVFDHYSFRTIWSPEDNEFVGLCSEFPGLSWLADTSEAAFAGVKKLVSECVDDMKKAGEEPPEPLTYSNYSGKFMVRLTPEVHRSLVLKAADQGVSLNRFVVNKLSDT